MKKIVFSLLAATALTLPAPFTAQAQDYKTILDIPAGQTIINLSANERVEVQQDLLVASLRFESENVSPKALQDEINKIMTKALDLAKTYKDVKVETDQYYVYPYDPEPPKPLKDGEKPSKSIRTWRGSQGLTIKSTTANQVLELTGALQEMGLSMNGLNYTISPALIEKTQDSLMEIALAKLQAKAERTAKALGKSKADLVEVNVDVGGNYYPQPMMMRAMAMDAGAVMEKAAPPVAAPGQSDINLTVSARAVLKP